MSALDLFAMLNAPLPGNGAGASASGQSDNADGAFAGLLAMMAPKGNATGAATAATTAAAGTPLAPFRFNVSGGALASSDDGPADTAGDGGQDVDSAAGHEDGVVLAGLNTAAPTPAPPPTARTRAARSAPEGSSAPAPASPPTTPPVSAEADPTTPPAGSGEGESSPTNGRSPAPAAGRAETGAALQGLASPDARPVQANQTAKAPHASQAASAAPPGALADPAPGEAGQETAPAPIRTAAGADPRVSAEAARAVSQQAATTAVASEAGRLAQPPRPEPAAAERRTERRAAEGRASLFVATESGDAPRPSVAAPAPTNAAVTPTPAPAPGTARVEGHAEAPPVPVDPATPDGEGAPEPARTTESQSATSVREHLPSTLARAGVETTALLSAQIVRRLEARSTRFDMVLTPEDLGRVDVRMEVDSDGQLTARLAFDNPAAAAELRGRADELRRQLEAAGFQMSEGSLEFAEREGGRRDQPFDQRERAFSGAGRLAADADVPSAPPRWTAYSLTPEGVDMKV